MIETKAGTEGRQKLRAEMEAKGFNLARMAGVLGVRETTLADWLDGKLNYTTELRVRKYLGMAPRPGTKPLGIELGQREPRSRPQPITDSVGDTARGLTPNIADPWPGPLPVANGHHEPGPGGGADEFVPFHRSIGRASEPSIRLGVKDNKIGYTVAFREALGNPAFARISYRERDGAILITAATAEADDAYRVGNSHDISASSAVQWMVQHGFRRGVRYQATPALGGMVITPEERV